MRRLRRTAQCPHGASLEEALLCAQDNDCLTVGVYESAKIMNLDPDSVAFCVLAADEDFECDIALQIHFTLIQSFCFDNEISIVRVGNTQRLAQIVGGGGDNAGRFEDAHCLLITMQSTTGKALKEALMSAQSEDRLTVGVYESAMIMNDDPDSVAFCVLAADEDFECDIALQIHFTLIQSFCFDNEISIVRVGNTQRLAQIVNGDKKAGRFEDTHCLLIMNPTDGSWEDPALEKLHLFCQDSRAMNDWLPEISLSER
ncbi:hypothetical protein CRUP_032173 [Coryphaenoides rupestris]|nr:hypothetical protein CRUP_032173 [Coryphaenoides rupestris]